MDLSIIPRLLQRFWGLGLVAVLVGLAAAGTLSARQQTVYQSTAKVFVAIESAGSVSDLTAGSSYVQGLVASYADLATTPYVLQRAARQLHLSDSVQALEGQVTAQVPSETVVIQITAQGSTSESASALAEAVAKSLIVAADDVSPATADATATVKITEVQPASWPATRLGTSFPVQMTIGGLAGLAMAVFLAFVAVRFDPRIRNVVDIERASGARVLGFVPLVRRLQGRPVMREKVAEGPPREAIRALRASLRHQVEASGSRLLVVTSSVPGEGKTSTVADLGIALADAGESVLIVDADLRAPHLATMLGLEASVGLCDVLSGRVRLPEVAQAWGSNGLAVIASGELPSNAGELMGSQAMGELLEEMRSAYSIVLFDSPPLALFADGAVLGEQSDGIVLVVSTGAVSKARVKNALDLIEQVGCSLVGVVATSLPTPRWRWRRAYQHAARGAESRLATGT